MSEKGQTVDTPFFGRDSGVVAAHAAGGALERRKDEEGKHPVDAEANPSAGTDQVVEYFPDTVVVWVTKLDVVWPWRENWPVDWKPV